MVDLVVHFNYIPLILLQQIPVDGGPIYAETDLQKFISEPWNAISSLMIAAPAIFWGIKLRGKHREYLFLTLCLPLLFLGGTGSALFHAFRSSRLLLLMDVLPTALLTFSVGIYFWHKIVKHWYWIILVVIPFILIRFWLFEVLPDHTAINVSYFVTGSMIFLPILFYLIQTRFHYYTDILFSVSMLSASLIFREVDPYPISWLPMGTHFLWHTFSGIGAFYLGSYLFRLRRDEISKEVTPS